MKRTVLLIILILIITLLCSCGQSAEPTPTPTQEIYMPTRSAATLPVPTRAASCTNIMQFLGDTNYEDGAVLAPGQTFVKEWEVMNFSDCAWDEDYHLFFISGDQMGAPDFISIPRVQIGEKGKIAVELTAPLEPGTYKSEWKLFGADNRFFGESLYTEITVE